MKRIVAAAAFALLLAGSAQAGDTLRFGVNGGVGRYGTYDTPDHRYYPPAGPSPLYAPGYRPNGWNDGYPSRRYADHGDWRYGPRYRVAPAPRDYRGYYGHDGLRYDDRRYRDDECHDRGRRYGHGKRHHRGDDRRRSSYWHRDRWRNR